MENNIFSGLSQLGLGDMSDMEIFEEEKKPQKEDGENKKPEVTEADLLYDKKYKCPLCDGEFKAKTIRAGKNKVVGTDTDLRAKYNYVDPVKYDCIVCTNCGYAALTRYFNKSSSMQLKLIKENISNKFKGVDETAPTYSYDEAIVRYKLALANAIVKKARNSEKGFICLKLAWLYRGKAEHIPTDIEDIEVVKKDLKTQEMQFIANAYKGFKAAMQTEDFPLCGMDEYTFLYVTADLARQCKDYSISMKLLGEIITSKAVTSRLKDKARELKDLIKEEVNKK